MKMLPFQRLALLAIASLLASTALCQTVTVNGLTEFTTSQTMTSLTIGTSGVARLTPGPGKFIDTQALNISPCGVLDLAYGNVLVVRAPNAAANAANLATITAWIKSGLNNGASGLWQGRGIISSDAASDPNHFKAVGVLDNSEIGYTTFGGVTGLTGNEVLVRVTRFGDSDLNGAVNGDDFDLFLIGFNGGAPSSWLYGDYNYDSAVNTQDQTLIDHSFNNGPANLLSAFTNPVPAEVWTPRESNRNWRSVASSANGSKLVAALFGGQIYTSTDSGVTWTPRESNRDWLSCASSADGSMLAAGVINGGQLYTSAWSATQFFVTDNLTGNINGLPLNASLIGVGDPATGHASLQASGVGPASGSDARHLISVSTYLCGVVADEPDGALNLLSLTGGNYSRQASLTFDTGEHLTATQTLARISSNQFAASVVLGGTVPHLGRVHELP